MGNTTCLSKSEICRRHIVNGFRLQREDFQGIYDLFEMVLVKNDSGRYAATLTGCPISRKCRVRIIGQ